MSEDRLGRIKQAIEENDGAPWPIVVEDCRWLISEVDRLTHLHNLDHSLADQWRQELDAAHRFLNDIGPPPDLPLPDRLRHWQNYCCLMRDDIRAKDATIASLWHEASTLRGALEPFIRDYPVTLRKSGPLPPGYTSDEFDAHCVFCDQGDRRTFTVRPHSKDCPIYGAKKALDHTEEEDGPLFEGKWTGSMGPTEEKK